MIVEALEPQTSGVLSALIPQDFNLDIHTSGNITGINHGDSKLLSLEASLHSTDGTVTCRRLRAEKCFLKGEQVQALSNLESLNLEVHAGEKGFMVGKRLGLDANAVITSEGPIKVGSLFCMMRNLPAQMLAVNNK